MEKPQHPSAIAERMWQLPIDQYYVERFLERHRDDIRGHVLEVQPSSYARSRAVEIEHLDSVGVGCANPQTTLACDLARDNSLPPGRYDCFLLAGAGHQIYELETAIRNATRALRPGGIMLT